MCLGTVEDAVGADRFPEVFVDVVICTAEDKKQSTGVFALLFIWQQQSVIFPLLSEYLLLQENTPVSG